MRATILALIMCALLSQVVRAQNATGQAVSSEADELSARVNKLYAEGKFDEALPIAQKVLAIREKELGPTSRQFAVALSNLGSIYVGKGSNERAEEYYQRALAVYEHRNEPETINVARVLDALAFLKYKRGDTNGTQDAYLRSLAIREKLFGPESGEAAHSIYNLGMFYSATGQYKKAEQHFLRLLDVREKLPESERRNYVDVAIRYACVLRKDGRTKEAEKVEADTIDETDKDEAKRVDAGILNGKALSLPRPEYPPYARKAQAEGTVNVRVVIDPSGKVIFACAIKGHTLLQSASEHAALRARFSPTTIKGRPVTVTGEITYNFVIR